MMACRHCHGGHEFLPCSQPAYAQQLLYGSETPNIADVLEWVEKKATGTHSEHEQQVEEEEPPIPMPGIVIWQVFFVLQGE